MRFARSLRLWIALVCLAGICFWARISSNCRTKAPSNRTINDLSRTSPLNRPGGGIVTAEAYEVYSALYRAPNQEPLAFAEDSVTDIPQVNGSCLKPSTAQEREMTDDFVAANQLSHRWEQKFAVPNGYRLLSRGEASEVETCLEKHGQDIVRCEAYKTFRHVRFLGVPGFDQAHTRALVSVIKMCGGDCGSGGIFAVERKGGTWIRSVTTHFTRDCSWMY
jgi:hypothetical protein